ncbi:MAG: C10 family peptidase [Daejeonella sp.]
MKTKFTKLTSIALLLTLLLIWIGCVKEKQNLNKTDSFLVTKEDATAFSDKHWKSSQTVGANHRTADRKIRLIETLHEENSDKPALYIINYESNNGFLILSADKRSIPLLAYSDSENFSLKQLNPGLINWLASSIDQIEDIRYKSENKRALTIHSDWKKFEKTSSKEFNENTLMDVPDSCYEDPICGIVCPENQIPPINLSPLLSTTWNQGCGYNDYCPPSSKLDYCYHMPAGCVATAMGQIMKYYQYPQLYNWNSMPNNSGSTYTSALLSSIGSYVNMSYSENGSGASDNQARQGFKDLDYTYPNRYDVNNYNANYGWNNIIKSELYSQRPVILSGCREKNSYLFKLVTIYGSCHMWVCDGMSAYYSCDGQGMEYFHMNWGWGGANNGYYLLTSLNPGFPHGYTYNMTMLTNIKPK